MRLAFFPAYGALPSFYAGQARQAEAPADFRFAHDKGVEWRAWLADVLSIINRCLWPSWDAARSAWGRHDLDAMNDLSVADFAILRSYQDLGYLSDFGPRTDVPDCPNHLAFFADEDQGQLGLKLGYYARDMPAAALSLPALAPSLLEAKVGHTSMVIKHRLQRPRPNQVAALMGLTWFEWHDATTSLSPAMCSGHCLQGLLIVGGLVEHMVSLGIPMSRSVRSALAQFAVDIGDRRVFAGVHYPSDNLASWIVAGALAHRVFAAPTIEFIREAVMDRSHVFKRLSEESSRSPVLRASLAEVHLAFDGLT